MQINFLPKLLPDFCQIKRKHTERHSIAQRWLGDFLTFSEPRCWNSNCRNKGKFVVGENAYGLRQPGISKSPTQTTLTEQRWK